MTVRVRFAVKVIVKNYMVRSRTTFFTATFGPTKLVFDFFHKACWSWRQGVSLSLGDLSVCKLSAPLNEDKFSCVTADTWVKRGVGTWRPTWVDD